MDKEHLKNFFSVPRSQLKGYFVLGLIFLVVVFAPAIYKILFYKPVVIDFEKDREQIEAFLTSLQFQNEFKKQNFDKSSKSINLDFPEASAAVAKLEPFPFNPNNLPAEQWLAMGFSEKQVQSIKKYEHKGGRFYTKKDVQKLWAISPEEYKILEPYILLPDSIPKPQFQKQKQKEEKTYQIVELNAADTTLLKTLPGIGSVFARKIYNYKIRLGGFYSKLQLLEIKDMDSARFAGIEPFIDVNPWLIRKMNVNTASFEQLSAHPYISKNVAISIINYRNRHGAFNVTEEIMKSELIDKLLYNKLAPYLTVE